MTNQLSTESPSYQSKFQFAAKLLFLALAYFASGKLGLAIPYAGSHISLIWLPTGIAVAALMRWGYICWPGIFLGALATNFSIDSSPLLDCCIALGNTLAPLLAAWLLHRLKFHVVLDRAYDILLLVVAAAIGMLVSAGGGVSSLVLFKVVPMQAAVATGLSWWAGDFVGVLLAAPLLLNISRAELNKLWTQRVEFLAWSAIMLAISWIVFFLNGDANRQSLGFMLFPVLVWSAMRFGMTGSSLGVLFPVVMGVVATSLGLGPFHTADVRDGLFLLWLFLATLVLVALMVAALQAGRKRAEAATQQSEVRFRQMFERHNSIMLLINPASGEIVVANAAASRFYGYPLEHLMNMNIAQINTKPLNEVAVERSQALREERNYFVFPHLLANGEMRTVEVYSSPVEVAGHTLLFSIIHDISERKKAEQAIREAKERFELIFNTSPDAVLISRLSDGYITDVNNAFTNLSGHTKEESMGNTTLGLNLWVNRDERQKFIDELQATGFRENFEAQFRKKDGSQHTGILSAGIITIQGVPHIVSTTRDISERKQIQQKSDMLLQRYQALMKSGFDGIHVMDILGNIIEANDSFCHMLGYTQEEMSRLNVADWDAYWSREELMTRFRELVQMRGTLFETTHRRKDGSLFDVEVSTTGVQINGQHYLFATSRDITERREAERAVEVLQAREAEALQEFRVMLNTSGEGFWKVDTSGNIVEVNDAYCDIVGYVRDEIVGAHISKFEAVEPAPEMVINHIRHIIELGTERFESKHRHRNGHLIDVEIVASYIEQSDCLIAFMHDVSERKQIEELLRIAAITFDTQEGIMITDADARILRVNQAFQDITGYGVDEVIGCNPRIFQSGRHDTAFFQAMWSELLETGKWAGEIWDKRKSGEIYPKLLTITAAYDDRLQITHYVAVFRDISNRKKSEQEIHRLAFYDSLTMLPNRRLLLDRLQQALAVSARNGRHGALLFLDLDHFKTINDTQGHAMGDQLLIEVARRLQTCVREGDSVARLGGDEFVVLLEELSSEADEAATQTELVAEKIRSELDQPYLLKDYECLSTVSIGISLFSGHPESAEDLLMHADVAMYQAKTAGRNAIRFFDPQMQAALEARAALEADLRHALEKQQFRLYYQIQVDGLRRPLGAEVLLRWEHPERGLVVPEHFIPTAEETGLIVPIGLWVLRTACAQLKEWQNDALTCDLTLAVNVSAKQFRQPDFVAQVQRVLMESGAKPSHLKLELTESTVLENVEDTISKMRELKILGVGFSMDDFGTGYSSLQYLKRLPLDQIKIDQSFVRDIATDPNDAAIVQTIIAMTEALGLDVIAEGVETEAQREFLDLRGCHAFQGYLFGKPMTVKQFKGLL